MNELADLISRAERVLERLEQILPGPATAPDWSTASAFRWRRRNGRASLQAVGVPHAIRLADLRDVDEQKARIDRNTRQFLPGRRANNVLLTGARGTGKSSLIKALLSEYAAQGLRLIEVDKTDLVDLPEIVELVAGRPERSLLFCDDLSFEEGEDAYKALKSVLEQFQEELWARFTIPLVRLDSVGLERVRRRIPANHNPFYYFDRAIISIDTLKKDDKYRRFLEQCQWDAVVVDECQHVAVRARAGSKQRSQRSKLAELLARTSEALILTSATPHDGKKESFASLMNLLEPTAIAEEQDYGAEDVQGLFVRRFKKDVQA